MAYPKIVYNGGSGDVTLQLAYPPINKPGADLLEADRKDSFTASGLRQSVTVYVSTVRNWQVEYIPFDGPGNITEWASFMAYAVRGGSFLIYPDADLSAYDEWWLDDTNFTPTLWGRSMSKLELKFLLVPGGRSSA